MQWPRPRYPGPVPMPHSRPALDHVATWSGRVPANRGRAGAVHGEQPHVLDGFPRERTATHRARLCGVLAPTAAQMESPIIAARWVARTALMKEIRAKRTSLAHKEQKSKRHSNSLDRRSSGGKKYRNVPSPPLMPLPLRAGLHKVQAETDSDPRPPAPDGSLAHLTEMHLCGEAPGEIQGWAGARVPAAPRRGIGGIRAPAPTLPPPPLSEDPVLLPEAEVESRWGPC